MVREAKIRGRVQTEVDERRLRQSTDEIKSKMESATNIVPQLQTSRLRRRLERMIPGGRTASRAIRELGGSDSGGSGSSSAGPQVEQEQLRELRRIRRTLQKDAVTDDGGGSTIVSGGVAGGLATTGKVGLGVLGLGGISLAGLKTVENAPRGYNGQPQDEDRIAEANERLYGLQDDIQSAFNNGVGRLREAADQASGAPERIQTAINSAEWPELPDINNMDWPELPDISNQDWPELPDLQSVTDWPELPDLDAELDWPQLPDLASEFSWPDPPDWIEQPLRDATGTEDSDTPARDVAASGTAELIVDVTGLDGVGVGSGPDRRELEEIIEDYLREQLR